MCLAHVLPFVFKPCDGLDEHVEKSLWNCSQEICRLSREVGWWLLIRDIAPGILKCIFFTLGAHRRHAHQLLLLPCLLQKSKRATEFIAIMIIGQNKEATIVVKGIFQPYEKWLPEVFDHNSHCPQQQKFSLQHFSKKHKLPRCQKSPFPRRVFHDQSHIHSSCWFLLFLFILLYKNSNNYN